MLIYDGDCGFCRRSLGWARALGAAAPAAPWQALDLTGYDLTTAEATSAAWFIQGRTRASGHLAIAAFLATSRHWIVRALAHLLASRLAAPAAARTYAWVAEHRHRLPGGTTACRTDRTAA